jgi:hypothetical protein
MVRAHASAAHRGHGQQVPQRLQVVRAAGGSQLSDDAIAPAAPTQVLIGPHGSGLYYMLLMRGPGRDGVAAWLDRDGPSFGTDAGMGPGDPVPVVLELNSAVGTPEHRTCYMAMANALGLR